MPDLTITLNCNNNCRFCSRDTLKDICVEKKDISRLLNNDNNKERIVLSGGEVTVLKDVLRLVSRCKESGYGSVAVITNGRRLSDKLFLRSLVNAGVNEMGISIYSTQEKIHDNLTRIPGSCRETLMGLSNAFSLKRTLSGNSLAIHINVLINSINYSNIYETLRKLYSIGARDFLLLNIIGIKKDNLFVSYDKIVDLFQNLSSSSGFGRSRFVFRGYPLCIFRNYVEKINKKMNSVTLISKNNCFFICETQNFDNYKASLKKGSLRYLAKCSRLYTHTKQCKKCIFFSNCLGIQKKYLEQFNQ